MKKSSQVSVATAVLLLSSAPSAYGIESTARAPAGLRPSASRELEAFATAWHLPPRGVIAVLVYVRSWFHNLIVTRDHVNSPLQPGDLEVVLAFARWLDGIPQVVKALPERVAMEEAETVKLVAPSFLPDDLLEALRVMQTGPRENGACGSTVAPTTGKAARSNAERLSNDGSRLGFVSSAPSTHRKPSRAKTNWPSAPEGR